MDDLKFTHIAETSAQNYKVRLEKLSSISGKTLIYILSHPRELYSVIVDHTNGKCVTIANYVTAVCKVFSSYPDIADKYNKSYKKWKQLLYRCRNEQNQEYSANMASEEKLKQVVSMQEIQRKYIDLKANEAGSMRHLLLSCFSNLVPKRADLGNVRIYLSAKDIPVDSNIHNFVYLGADDNYRVKPFLQINKFKTSGTYKGGIRELINDKLYADIIESLKVYPRQYLFVDSRGKPYIKNNSYSQFVKRTFEGLFGKGKNMGVSLWRHVYVSSQIDFNKMSERDIAEKIRNMGTSENQVRQVYKWINMNPQGTPQVSPGTQPVIIKQHVCETVCRPL